MKFTGITIGLFLFVTHVASATKISREEYVEQWKATAIEQMLSHNVPASITLAQGILESGAGNSTLAREANNHFGIKCHGWKGDTFFQDDDKKDECFRVYPSAKGSYEDHSLFLNKYDRYAFLFEYDQTDYKSWAKGLKKAGYATNPKYPQLLITIIEELGLDQFDKATAPIAVEAPIIATINETTQSNQVYSNTHQVNLKGKTKYIEVKKGDTYYRIAQEFGLTLGQLYRYNKFDTRKDVLEEGDIVYLQRRRRFSD